MREAGSNLGSEVTGGHNLNEVAAGVNWAQLFVRGR